MTDAHGTVEGRRPAADRWTGRARADVLVEFERVRTLSESTAQVTFRDLSRLRLNPNSNATIQTMRSDPLTGGRGHEDQPRERRFLCAAAPAGRPDQLRDRGRRGGETSTEIADFWVRCDAGGAKFANFDGSAPLVVGTLALGRNEGAVIGRDGSVRVADVPGRVALAAPDDAAQTFAAAVPLGWAAVPDAAGYWVEVASDAGFNVMRISDRGVQDTAFAATGLPPGIYHWRVAALDSFGLPGPWSAARRFERIEDSVPPFVLIAAPAEGAPLEAPGFTLTGETEPGAALTLDGAPVAVDADGRFALPLRAAPGPNAFAPASVDAAGNRAERALTVVWRPAAAVTLTPDTGLPRDGGGVFLTAAESLAFAASTDAAPGAPVVLRDTGGADRLRAIVEPGGRIELSIPAVEAPAGWTVAVLAPSGAAEGTLALTVARDTLAPVLRLDPPPPPATASAFLTLTAVAEGAAALTLDGAALPLAERRFAAAATLAPGANRLELRAVDAVGNTTLMAVGVTLDSDPPEIRAAPCAPVPGPRSSSRRAMPPACARSAGTR